MSRTLKTLYEQVDQIRDGILVLTMANSQTLEVCLSVRDSRFLPEELARMLELAGDQPLGEGHR